jgi:hypothetical protein
MPASRPCSALAPHVVTVVLLACAGACGSSSSGTNGDSNANDSGAIDAGAIDSGTTDARAADSGVTDSSATDAIATDSMPAPSMAASCIDGVVGTWQNITPPAVATVLAAEGLDASSGGPSNNGSWGTSTVVVDPSTPSTLYVSADGQGIFKSMDCGGTWTRIDNPSDNFSENTGSVYSWALVIDPTDTQIIYANDGYGPQGVFKSTNGGQTFSQTFTGNLVGPGMGAGSPVTSAFIDGGFIGTIRMDPTNHLHLLVSPHHSCNAPYPEYCLLETFDGAATWTVVSTNIDVANADGPWADLTDPMHFYVGGLPNGGLYLSTNGGTDWSEASGITDIVYGSVYHSPATGKYLLPSANGVLQSTDGEAWSLIPGTPGAISNTLTGDGKSLYFSRAFPGFMATFYTASENDPSTWTMVGNPPGPIGFVSLAIEPVNHFLYSSDTYGGLWRNATQ